MTFKAFLLGGSADAKIIEVEEYSECLYVFPKQLFSFTQKQLAEVEQYFPALKTKMGNSQVTVFTFGNRWTEAQIWGDLVYRAAEVRREKDK